MPEKPLQLETQNLILRPWQDSDATSLLGYVRNPLVGRAAGWMPPGEDAKSEKILKHILTRPITFILALKPTDYPLGSIALLLSDRSKLVKSTTEGEIGFWLGQEFWHHGYMTEALEAMLKYSFTVQKLTKLWYGYFSDNIKSRSLAAKFGFHYIYTRHYTYWPALHTIKSERVAMLTVAEWQTRQK